MARDDDYEDDYADRGHLGSGGRSYGGHGAGDRNAHEARNLNTTELISKDGSIAGIPTGLDPATVGILSGGQNMLQAWFRRHAQDYFETWGPQLAQQFGHASPQEIAKFTERMGLLGGGLVLFGDSLLEIGVNTGKALSASHQLGQASKLSAKLAGGNSYIDVVLGSDNEVVKNANKKIRGGFLAGNALTVIKALGDKSLLLLDWHQEQKTRRKELRLKNSLTGGDAEQFAKLMEEDMAAGLSSNMEATREKMWKKMWETRREKYLAEYKEFEKAQQKVIEKEFLEELDFKKTSISSVPTEINQTQYEALEKYGLTSYFHPKTSRDRSGYAVDGKYTFTNDEHKKAFKSKLEKALKDKIASEYVKQHGALDEAWKEKLNVGKSSRGRYGYGGGYNDGYGHNGSRENPQKTIREQYQERFNKAFDDAHGLAKGDPRHKKEEEGENRRLKEMAYAAGGSMIGNFLRKALGAKTLERYSKEAAADLITHLARTMKEHDTVDSVPPLEGSKESDKGFAQYVHSIFQRHQEDSGRAKIVAFKQLEGAKWDDEAIQKLDDGELNPYEYAVKHISKAIKDRRMDPLVLFTLVGDKKRKIVHDNGKAFGPAGMGSDAEKIKEAIGKELNEFGGHFRTKQQLSDEQKSEIMASLPEAEKLRAHFASAEIPREQKAFNLMDLESRVPDAKMVRELTGLDDKALEALRKEDRGHFNKYMDAGVLALSKMIEKDPETLRTVLGMDEEGMDVIRAISCKIEKGMKNVVESAQKEARDQVESAVLNASVSLGKTQDKDGTGFWQRLIEHSRRKIEKKASKDEGDDALSSRDGEYDEEIDEEKPSRSAKKNKHQKFGLDHDERGHDEDFRSPRLDEENGRPAPSFADREKKRGHGLGGGDHKPMLERLSAARNARDESHGPSWDISA